VDLAYAALKKIETSVQFEKIRVEKIRIKASASAMPPSHNPERLQPLRLDRPATATGKPCPNTKLVSTAPLAKLTRQ